jgi:hypothetical protein
MHFCRKAKYGSYNERGHSLILYNSSRNNWEKKMYAKLHTRVTRRGRLLMEIGVWRPK